jgi:hypothetical protein
MALLCVADDGRADGEWYRIRSDSVIIGRSQGDVVVPHDHVMSARHAEIARVQENGQWRWYLTDLGSTNGTYIRVMNALLQHRQELILGHHRYRFNSAPQGKGQVPELAASDAEVVRATADWQEVARDELLPSLVEITAQGDGPHYFLTKTENWVGRDAKHCSVVLPHDPMISQRHARIYRDSKGRWHVESKNSRNGTWVRITETVFDVSCEFQLGEQRFIVRVL